MKPKVIVTYDAEGWAFYRIAMQIAMFLSDEFDIRLQRCREPLATPDADVVLDLFYGRGDPASVPPAARRITCVYDGWYWPNTQVLRGNIEQAIAAGSHVLFANKRFAADFVPLLHPRSWGLCQDGVDTDLFHPVPLAHPRQAPLVVGWAGNMAHAMKGVGLIRDAVKELEGVQLDCVGSGGTSWPTADGRTVMNSRYPPARGVLHEDMPAWYSTIDVYVCASEVEGTPNPILEASACGIPWISTDVGIVPELIADAGDGLKPGIVVRREVGAIADALRLLSMDLDLGVQMGLAGRRIIERNWTWPERIGAFRSAIRLVLDQAL